MGLLTDWELVDKWNLGEDEIIYADLLPNGKYVRTFGSDWGRDAHIRAYRAAKYLSVRSINKWEIKEYVFPTFGDGPVPAYKNLKVLPHYLTVRAAREGLGLWVG